MLQNQENEKEKSNLKTQLCVSLSRKKVPSSYDVWRRKPLEHISALLHDCSTTRKRKRKDRTISTSSLAIRYKSSHLPRL